MPARKREDVVILGGGVFGCSLAYHLAKEGIYPLLIEMDSIGAKASGKAAGLLFDDVGSFFVAGSELCAGGRKRLLVPFMIQGYRRFEQLYLQLQEEAGLDIQCKHSPFFYCALSEEEEKTLNAIASEAKSEGLDAKWISGDEMRGLENTVTTEVRGAIVAHCNQVEPYRYTLALAQAAEKMGASIKYRQAVGFRCERNRVTAVKLSTGEEIPAGTVVIAMGPWSAQAASWLGLRLPVTAFRAEILKIVAPKHPTHQISFIPPAGKEWPHVFAHTSPRVDGTLFLGYTEDHPEDWDNSRPETWTDSPSAEMRDLMMEHAVRFVPILEDAMLVEHRAAVLANPPGDGIVIGPLPKWENVYMVTVGDIGICVSLEVGRIITDLIVGGDRAKRAVEEVESVSPGRFMSFSHK